MKNNNKKETSQKSTEKKEQVQNQANTIPMLHGSRFGAKNGDPKKELSGVKIRECETSLVFKKCKASTILITKIKIFQKESRVLRHVAVVHRRLVLGRKCSCGPHSGGVPSRFCSARPLVWAQTSRTNATAKFLEKAQNKSEKKNKQKQRHRA